MFHLNTHRLPLIEECLKALADCREGVASMTVIASHMERMTREQVSAYNKLELARRLAALIVNDAEIMESIVWSIRPGEEPNETNTKFVARTVIMRASTYHELCQALRHLRTEALEDQSQIKP